MRCQVGKPAQMWAFILLVAQDGQPACDEQKREHRPPRHRQAGQHQQVGLLLLSPWSGDRKVHYVMCGTTGLGPTNKPIDESVVQPAQAACPMVLIWLVLCVLSKWAVPDAQHECGRAVDLLILYSEVLWAVQPVSWQTLVLLSPVVPELGKAGMERGLEVPRHDCDRTCAICGLGSVPLPIQVRLEAENLQRAC